MITTAATVSAHLQEGNPKDIEKMTLTLLRNL